MFVCKEYEARISALIDDELPPGERAEVLEHIAQCPACKAHWEDCLTMRDALREESCAPVGFAESVMAQVRETAQETVSAEKVLRFPGWKRFASLAACCAVIVLGVWMMGISPEKNMSDCAVSNRSAAPEAVAENDCANNGMAFVGGDSTESYGFLDDGNSTPACEAPSDQSHDAESNCSATMTTASKLAAQWVEQNLGENWVSGACYSLSEEQYFELRTLLEHAGELFNEITGNENDGGYLLLAK